MQKGARLSGSRYANVSSTVALIIALLAFGGGAYAASKIDGGDIAPQSIKGAKIAPNAIPGSKLRPRLNARINAGGEQGPPGQRGPRGPIGPVGPEGAPAPAQYAEFYSLTPPDNPATVPPGDAVSFPNDGPSAGGLVRSSDSTFVVPQTGTYRIAFSVPVTEAGQLQLERNDIPLAYTVVGRATGTSPIAGESLVEADAGDVISVINPPGNSTALTITPLAGGTEPVSASLIIEQLPDAP